MTNKNGNGGPTATVIIKRDSGNALGIAAFVFGLISIFTLAPIFVPLAVIVGVIAVIKKQLAWGILGLVCAVLGFATSPILLGLVGFATIGANPDLLPDPTTMFPQRSTPRQATELDTSIHQATQQPQPNTQRPDQPGVRWYEKSGMPGLDTSTKPTPGNKNVVYKLSLNASEVCGLPPNTLVTVGIEDFIYWLRNKAGGQLVAQTGRSTGIEAAQAETLPVQQKDLYGGILIGHKAYDDPSKHLTDGRGCVAVKPNLPDWIKDRYPFISTRSDPKMKAKDDPSVTLTFSY